jgi:ferredoxin
MLDAGATAHISSPTADDLAEFRGSPSYRRHILGTDFEGLAWRGVSSPKLRMPVNRFAFEGFTHRTGVRGEGFYPVGSVARGGLSGIWGAGIAEYDADELSAFPRDARHLGPSYREVGARIGVSGSCDDDVSSYLGSYVPLRPPVLLGTNAGRVLARYEGARARVARTGVLLGRARNAVLTEAVGSREGCNGCGHCLWGCHRHAIWSAAFDLDALRRFENFEYRGNVFVAGLERAGGGRLRCRDDRGHEIVETRRIMLACGTLGSTALVLRTLGRPLELPLLSTPVAAFGLVVPASLGRAPDETVFGLSQLTLVHRDSLSGDAVSGNLFEAEPVPVTDFARHIDLLRPVARRVVRTLRPAMLVGNAYLPSQYGRHTVALDLDGRLVVRGAFDQALPNRLQKFQRAVVRAMRLCGAFVLPGSFKIGDPGTDVHYAGTMPMSDHPSRGQTDVLGEVAGLPGVHVVDGACLPSLPAKAHTLTVMANADRIGRRMSEVLATNAG